MLKFPGILGAVTVLLACVCKADTLIPLETAIDTIAAEIEFDGVCHDWTMNDNDLAKFMIVNNVRVNDSYRELLRPARYKYNAMLGRLGPQKACERAIEFFGPKGTKIPGLLAPKTR